jgi:hypothetical protein
LKKHQLPIYDHILNTYDELNATNALNDYQPTVQKLLHIYRKFGFLRLCEEFSNPSVFKSRKYLSLTNII